MAGMRFWSVCLAAVLMLGAGRDGMYLRVIGRDDTAAAQEEKLRVRDAVLGVCPEDAFWLGVALPAVHRAANGICPCRVTVRSWSPEEKREPKPTLYVTVGEGRGHNWWGVLYDGALRMAQIGEEAPPSPDKEAELPRQNADAPVEFVWPLWDRLLRLLGIA